MAKQLIFNEQARFQVKEGIDQVANAIRITLGPHGRNAILGKSYGSPTITNDGVSIAREISLKDPFQNMGAEMVKEVANKTNDQAGDGTSTSAVLMQSLIEEGIKRINKGVNTLSIRDGMKMAHKKAEEILGKIKRDVKGQKDIVRVATISAESEEIGKIIATTIEKVGNDGVVTVEESQSSNIESDIVEGLEIDKGYVSPYMVTNPERMEAECKDISVLITDKKVSSIKEILPILEKLAQSGKKDLLLIADDIDGEALTTFVLNRIRGTFNVTGIKAPGFGDRKNEMLEDIAVTVGATVVSESTGMKFDSVELDVLGVASRALVKKDSTVIVGSKSTKGAVQNRVRQLKVQADQTDSNFDKEKIAERIAKLSGGVAVIRVGAATETEMKYLKLKIEDAVAATKAAIEEGIIPGGGAPLAYIAATLKKSRPKTMHRDQQDGYDIVADALEAPMRQIVDNSLGNNEGIAIVREIQVKNNPTTGFDAIKKEISSDMFARGIIDPVKVTRSALSNALSSASIFLTTEVAIADIEEDTKDTPQMPGGMPGMGMGM